MTNQPYFHDASGSVRFWVLIGGQQIGATIGKEILHYLYRPVATDDMPMDTYAQHAPELDAAVRRRVAAGSFQPVMLREFDLK
ncbi:hypothetical protein QTI66_22820 [Variovorax sp. J22R133]|uniref:hypothetical protein n=1 Tax=Variovorax brevis TaxID=3053503 RepID=UPI0025788EC0|nr:hypothetical protein [Variovorax sp. J22R133]MDM0115000.1 hypothetical protein [Variovorax sp. J22R133]